MSKTNYLFTSESVTEGHPDKIADRISDSILDAIMADDKQCRVACETMVTTGMAIIAGEITTDASQSSKTPGPSQDIISDHGFFGKIDVERGSDEITVDRAGDHNVVCSCPEGAADFTVDDNSRCDRHDRTGAPAIRG